MNIEKIKKDITHHLNYVPEMSQTTYNALKGALDIINALEDIKAEIEDLEPDYGNTGYGFESYYKCQSEVLKIIDKHIEGV